jgi:hypothetical protein
MQRGVKHRLKAYAFLKFHSEEEFDAAKKKEMLQVIGIASSPPFTLASYRRSSSNHSGEMVDGIEEESITPLDTPRGVSPMNDGHHPHQDVASSFEHHQQHSNVGNEEDGEDKQVSIEHKVPIRKHDGTDICSEKEALQSIERGQGVRKRRRNDHKHLRPHVLHTEVHKRLLHPPQHCSRNYHQDDDDLSDSSTTLDRHENDVPFDQEEEKKEDGIELENNHENNHELFYRHGISTGENYGEKKLQSQLVWENKHQKLFAFTKTLAIFYFFLSSVPLRTLGREKCEQLEQLVAEFLKTKNHTIFLWQNLWDQLFGSFSRLEKSNADSNLSSWCSSANCEDTFEICQEILKWLLSLFANSTTKRPTFSFTKKRHSMTNSGSGKIVGQRYHHNYQQRHHRSPFLMKKQAFRSAFVKIINELQEDFISPQLDLFLSRRNSIIRRTIIPSSTSTTSSLLLSYKSLKKNDGSGVQQQKPQERSVGVRFSDLLDELIAIVYKEAQFQPIRAKIRHLLAATSPFGYQAFVAQMREMYIVKNGDNNGTCKKMYKRKTYSTVLDFAEENNQEFLEEEDNLRESRDEYCVSSTCKCRNRVFTSTRQKGINGSWYMSNVEGIHLKEQEQSYAALSDAGSERTYLHVYPQSGPSLLEFVFFWTQFHAFTLVLHDECRVHTGPRSISSNDTTSSSSSSSTMSNTNYGVRLEVKSESFSVHSMPQFQAWMQENDGCGHSNLPSPSQRQHDMSENSTEDGLWSTFILDGKERCLRVLPNGLSTFGRSSFDWILGDYVGIVEEKSKMVRLILYVWPSLFALQKCSYRIELCVHAVIGAPSTNISSCDDFVSSTTKSRHQRDRNDGLFFGVSSEQHSYHDNNNTLLRMNVVVYKGSLDQLRYFRKSSNIERTAAELMEMSSCARLACITKWEESSRFQCYYKESGAATATPTTTTRS